MRRRRQGDVDERFWSKVDRDGPGGCWLWAAAQCPWGYGRFWLNGRTRKAHRVSYVLAFGDIPAGLQVLHRCDIPLCVNPEHLALGTNADNHADKIRKGRQRGPVGESNRGAKLTSARVAEIREAYARGGVTQLALASRFGMSQQSVSCIINNKRWRAVAPQRGGE